MRWREKISSRARFRPVWQWRQKEEETMIMRPSSVSNCSTSRQFSCNHSLLNHCKRDAPTNNLTKLLWTKINADLIFHCLQMYWLSLFSIHWLESCSSERHLICSPKMSSVQFWKSVLEIGENALSSTTSSSNKHAHQIEQSLFNEKSWSSSCLSAEQVATLLWKRWQIEVQGHLPDHHSRRTMRRERRASCRQREIEVSGRASKQVTQARKKNRPFLGLGSLCEDLCVNRRDPIGDERGAFFILLGVFSLSDKWIDLLLRWETTREKCSVKNCASWVQHISIDGKRYTGCSCLAGALIDSFFVNRRTSFVVNEFDRNWLGLADGFMFVLLLIESPLFRSNCR